MFLGCFANRESNGTAVICSPNWAQYGQQWTHLAGRLPDWCAVPVVILLGPCWAVGNRVIIPGIRQVILGIQGTAQGRLGSQWGLWAFWVLSTQWHCTGQGSPGSESSDGLPGEIEYDFCVRQMNLCWFMWADNLPLPKIWRNLWCWNQPLNNLYLCKRSWKASSFFLCWLGYSMISLGWSVLPLCWWPQDAESIDRVFYF